MTKITCQCGREIGRTDGQTLWINHVAIRETVKIGCACGRRHVWRVAKPLAGSSNALDNG